jgi:hypothetical protein
MLAWFVGMACTATAIYLAEVFHLLLREDSLFSGTLLDLWRSTAFVFWTLSGISAAVKEIRQHHEDKTAELRGLLDKKKRAEVTNMLGDFGWNLTPPKGTDSDDADPLDTRVVPIRRRTRPHAN